MSAQLRTAAQQALEALIGAGDEMDVAMQDAFVALRAALAQPEYPLPESLYPDSKDWAASDYAGRVEWLHFMYESKKREVEQLETAMPEQEPFGWLYESKAGGRIFHLVSDDKKLVQADWEAAQQYPEAHKMTPLYLHPPQRKPQPEPVAWGCFRNGVLLDDLVSDEASVDYWCASDEPEMQRLVKRALYTAPLQRKPLTEEALMALLPGAVRLPLGWKDFARAIENAHGIGGEHE